MMAPTILNIASSVKPIILNGSNISQAKANKKNIIMANGQHNTKRIHQSIKVANVLIDHLNLYTFQPSQLPNQEL